MTPTTQKKSFFKGGKRKLPPLSLLFILVTATLLGVGGFGIWTVEKQMKENLATQLELIVQGNLESLKIWAQAIKLDTQVLSRQPTINEKLTSLLEIAQPDTITTETLSQSEELAWLRKNLGEACKTYGFVGFVVFDLTGLQVGSYLDGALGTRNLLGKSDFFYRSMQGDTVVSQPFYAEIDLPDEEGVYHSDEATMFVSTPILGQAGETVGVLAFRLRPEKEFSHLLSISRFGDTGETYAFNDEGLLVSNSRFDSQLISSGLLLAGQKSILNIYIRDPNRNLQIKAKYQNENTSLWPLTKMVTLATKHQSGFDVDGYNDYRGVSVVGAWVWEQELDIGLVTEIDVAEAFRPLKTLMTWFLLLFGLLLIFGATAFFLRSRYTRSQQETLENEKRLSSFLDTASDSIICIDTFGTIQSVNSSVAEKFGYEPSELLRKNIKILMPKPHSSAHDGYLEAYLKTGKGNVINMVSEVTAKRKNGNIFPIELSVSESVVKGEKSYMGIIRDISERKESEKELKNAYGKLEERIEERTKELWESKNLAEKNNKAKSEFLSRMSHELRTPMNAILGFTQLMHESTKDPLPKTHQNRTEQILKAGNHLLELINEVLDLASIEAGKITVSIEPVCIADLITEVLTVVRPLAQNFHIDLIDKISFNKKVTILADKTRLKQVLLNLLSNSIKYNNKGGSVTVSSQLEKGSRLRIDVIDTGVGMSREQLNQLFDPFNRLGAENGNIEGTGIGMTISKNLVEAMNGSIGVESQTGKGSTFNVSFPICLLSPATETPKVTLTPIDELENGIESNAPKFFTLLYIEDNAVNLTLVEDILADYSEIKLISASTAITGINMALSQNPNLILMDINLPDIDGVEALKRLKKFKSMQDVPVIAISANAMKKDIDRAMSEGFKAYIAKPFDIERFKKIIENEMSCASTL
ncbi:MAG: PAS domain S-box protein [Nitrospinaceae bacterium]|nr:PAS domain S-box protein [Nitrospinaceae bacterium]